MSGAGASLRVGAVLLAAGESRRMGGLDKRRLLVDGEPLVRRWLRLLREAGIRDRVVVVGHQPQRILPLLEGEDATVVLHPEYRRGQQSSVLAGLAALPAEIDAAMVVLVDLVLVDAADLRELLGAFAARPAGSTALVPFFEGRRGNPVIVAAEVVARVLAEVAKSAGDGGGEGTAGTGDDRGRGDDGPAGLRGYLQSHPDEVHRHPASSDHFTVDLDTPEDIDRLEGRLGRSIGRMQDDT